MPTIITLSNGEKLYAKEDAATLVKRIRSEHAVITATPLDDDEQPTHVVVSNILTLQDGEPPVPGVAWS